MSGQISSITRLLRTLRQRLWLRWSVGAWLAALPLSLLLLLLGSGIESILWLDPAVRVWLFLFTVILAGLPLLFALGISLLPFFRPALLSDKTLARRILHRDPKVSDRLLIALELTAELRPGVSAELAELARGQAETLAGEINPNDYLDPLLPVQFLRALYVELILLAGLLLVAAPSLFDASLRLFHPNTSYERPNATMLELAMPDTIRVTEGDSLRLAARGRYLHDDVLFRIEDYSGVPRLLAATVDSSDSSRHTATAERLLQSGLLFATSGRVMSDTSHIVVVHRPRVAQLHVRVTPPAYTGRPTESLPQGVGDVAALPGSRVEVRLESSRPLSAAQLYVQSEGSNSHRNELRARDLRADGSFTMIADGRWWVELTAEDGVVSEEPVRWSLRGTADEPPLLDVRLPKPDALINDNLIVPLWAVAEDDYGISRMRLRWQIVSSILSQPDSGEAYFDGLEIQYETDEVGRAVVRTLWNLETLPLLPTDEVHWFIEVWDNDAVGGAKRVRSETRRLLFPSVEELLTRTDDSQAAADEQLSDALEQAKRLEERLRETLEIARSNPDEVSWEQAQALQRTLEQQQEAMDQLEQVQENLEQLQQLAEEHGTLSDEVLEKYSQMQELLSEIVTPEMREAMEKLQRSLEGLDGEQVREALEKMLADQEALRKNLERSLAVLRQLREERRLDELASLAESLADRQQQLAEASKESSSDPIRLTREQELISQELKTLRERMAETASDSSLQHEDIADSLAALERKIEEAGLEKTLQRSQQQLQSGNLDQASQPTAEGGEQLQSLAEQLRSLQQEIQQRGKEDVLGRIDRLFDGMLAVSEQQQALRARSENLGVASPLYRSLAADQRSLIDAVGQLRRDLDELNKRTFFVGKALDAQLELTGESMEKAVRLYTDRQARQASGSQTDALTMLHRGLYTLLQSRQEAQQAGSGTGYDEMMKKLEQMAQMQQQLNEGSGQMPMPMPGSAGAQTLAQMAAQQRALAQQLQQMQPRGGSAREILGNLEGVGRAMEEVARDLEDRNVTDRTRRLQRRILQHLLDSQRSLAQQDQSRERVGRIADDVRGIDPGGLDEERASELEQRLEKALAGEWDEQWRETIRAYFRALQRDRR